MTATVPDSDFEMVDLPSDVPVPTEFEFACEDCGTELFYAGRGRKPKRCDKCKEKSPGTGAGKRRGSGANASLARQAADTLGGVNELVGLGLMLAPGPLHLPKTGSALVTANERFTEPAYNALLADPALARLIVRGGGISGKVALIIAYAMMLSAVVPVGVEELRAKGGTATV